MRKGQRCTSYQISEPDAKNVCGLPEAHQMLGKAGNEQMLLYHEEALSRV